MRSRVDFPDGIYGYLLFIFLRRKLYHIRMLSVEYPSAVDAFKARDIATLFFAQRASAHISRHKQSSSARGAFYYICAEQPFLGRDAPCICFYSFISDNDGVHALSHLSTLRTNMVAPPTVTSMG
ncbi:hypothetical protein SDC9_181375 [bioreactor metagenome]|uniref:Uncharacterized protein n=1 Tax=bioreactor metagenome TaxID=1076179 RepID=A0A645HDN0_9ZZZZ